jgi:TonB family protein
MRLVASLIASCGFVGGALAQEPWIVVCEFPSEFPSYAILNSAEVAPEYPPPAVERGLEGECAVTFDVSPAGTVVAGSVRAECSHEVFAESAENTVERWRFAPLMVDGVATARFAVEHRIEFQLAEDS